MNALFLIFHGLAEHSGISKKIISQKEALERCGLNTRLCYISQDPKGNILRKVDDKIIDNFRNDKISTLRRRFDYKNLYKYICKEKITFLYIRSSHNANPFLNRMLKKLHKRKVKIVIEIPTYPYENEHKNDSLKEKLYFSIHKLCRKKMASYSDGIVTFSNEKIIEGQKAINISNGIDFEKIPLKKEIIKKEGVINLVGVAEINFWHGYDRLINGLSLYYDKNPKIKVYFHIIGEGEPKESDKLKALVREKHLSSYVFFHGSLSGEELDKIFEKADIGIASLARHRSHIKYIKTLKNREYAARGIPFVYSEIDSDFEKMPYIMKIPADESPVNIGTLINFYHSVGKKPENIRASVRRLDWKAQMGKVLQAINIQTSN